MAECYLYSNPVSMFPLKQIGWLLTFGKGVSHARVYWQMRGKLVYTEMSSDPIKPGDEIVGKGDGYTIQIIQASDVKGIKIDCDTEMLEKYARLYASTMYGDLNSSAASEFRDYYSDPQGYGGPMYEFGSTCNTYIYYLLKKTCKNMPDKPRGAIGWNRFPRFPGPKK